MRFCFLALFLSLAPFLSGHGADQPKVLVSVAPQRFLVQSIVGTDIAVESVVPAASSPHTYEPTPKQMVRLSDAVMWFRIGESFETKMLKVFNGKMDVIDAREGLHLLQATCSHGHEAQDLHIWLSPKLLKAQARQMGAALCKKFPEHKKQWKRNIKQLLCDLDALDVKVLDLLQGAQNRAVLVSHPAFAYFCQDYGLTQLSIEVEGKEPTAKQITKLLSKASAENIRCIFAQEQYSRRGAKRMAEVLGVEIAFLDPYAEDVIQNIQAIATAFHDSI